MENGFINSPVTSQDKVTDGVKYEKPQDRSTLDREDFMNLFVAQLQYQDPMNPMDSEQMASQVAQFNMVDLMYKNNDAINNMVKAEESRTRIDAVSMIGKDVRYEGNKLPVGPEGPYAFEYEFDKPAAACKITIKDESGRMIKQWNAGFQGTGRHSLNWDGTDSAGDKVPEAMYTISIEAMDEQGNDVDAKTWTTGQVDAVTFPDKGLPKLSIKGGPRLGFDQISMVANTG